MVHLILSGHTHKLFPEVLPEAVGGLDHRPLGNDQCQLIVGTLSQVRVARSEDPSTAREPVDPERKYGHQCQILRFFYDTSEPDLLLLQRLVAARRGGRQAGAGVGFGTFDVVPPSDELAFELG